MKAYKDASEVVVTTSLVDDDGNAIVATEGTYRVLDQDDNELVASSALTVDAQATEVQVTVPSAINTLGVGELRGLRVIEYSLVTAAGVVELIDTYLVEASSVLVVFENSFMTYHQALMVAFEVPSTPGWDSAGRQTRIAALKEAYIAINTLRFTVADFLTDFALVDMTADDISAIPTDFQLALRMAQIATADLALGGDPIDHKRRMGLMSETIGESSNMFRPGKPMLDSIGQRAYRYLAPYLSIAHKIGRA